MLTLSLVSLNRKTRRLKRLSLCGAILFTQGCVAPLGSDIQWDSKDQILLSESSQVKMRAIQTRVFDTTDRKKILQAVISTLQDLYFDIDVMDESLGLISAKKLYRTDSAWENHPTYYTYKTDKLVIFSNNYRTYGPFYYRNNLIRLSVTVRPKGETQSLVRVSIQHQIRAVDAPEVYQQFFKLLRQSQFMAQVSSAEVEQQLP